MRAKKKVSSLFYGVCMYISGGIFLKILLVVAFYARNDSFRARTLLLLKDFYSDFNFVTKSVPML
jgi:hypothetical protein